MAAALHLSSCASENTIGSIDDRLNDSITVIHDTSVVHRTVHDTLYDDTLTVYDTLWAPRDTSAALYFGLVYDMSGYGAPAEPYDSAYASLFALSDPRRSDLAVSVNATPLPPADKQRNISMMRVIDGYPIYLPVMHSVIYETILGTAGSYAFHIIVPIYPSDTALPTLYDTITDAVAAPALFDTFSFAGPSGSYAATSDTRIADRYFLIDNTSDVTIQWHTAADFYMVGVYKLVQPPGSSYPMAVGEPLEEFIADSQYTIPASFLRLDSFTPDSLVYDFVSVELVPINGPPPSQWDTLPSFESQGLLFALPAGYVYEILVPTVPDTGLEKRSAGLGKTHGGLSGRENIAQRVLSTMFKRLSK